jgi:hypothetical protein
MRGKPWPTEDELKLRDWFSSGTTDLRVLAFSFDSQYTQEAIRQKLIKFGLLREQQQPKFDGCCSSKLEIPAELPSVEMTLKTLAAALKVLETPKLEKSDVLRLRGIIAGCKVYKELFTDYVNYRGLEAELLEGRAKIAEFRKKASGTASK